MSQYSSIAPSERLPEWLRRPIGNASQLERVQGLVKENRLHTICEEGRCPNRGECYAAGTATFLLGGSICTRSCAFCQVEKGRAPMAVDPAEAERVADAVESMGLRYVVLTAVARDDLSDHGANLFTSTMAAIRARNPFILIEVLTPDFWGGVADADRAVAAQRERLSTVLAAEPVCFNHNLETVERLQGEVRRGATYQRSLALLAASRELAPSTPTKSGLMLGLGETREEVIAAMHDLRRWIVSASPWANICGLLWLTCPCSAIGLPRNSMSWGQVAQSLGFAQVRSGPLVRSSYHAAD
jgi:lipoic acid synthetase